jgi:hypothetical protein
MSALVRMADLGRTSPLVREVPRAVLANWPGVHFLSTGITGSISRDDELMTFKQLVPTLA